MIKNEIAHPNIVGRNKWLTARKALLEHEKAVTKQRDRVNAERRRLPMVKLEQDYTFSGPQGAVKLMDLFDGRTQLIIYHFMFAPEWEKGCMGCTGYVDALGNLSMLNDRDTTFVLISRAPLPNLEGWVTRTRHLKAGMPRGTPPSAALSTMTSTSRWMRPLR